MPGFLNDDVIDSGLSAPSLSSGTMLFTQEELDFLLAYMQENLMIPSTSDIAAAVLAALQTTAIPVNTVQINSKPLAGSGRPADPMRPA